MKKKFRVILFVFAALIVAAVTAGAYVKFFLPDVGPAPFITIDRTPERIERGKYLANHVAVRMDCHSKRDWNLYAGPMMKEGIGGGGEIFGREAGFPGVFYAPNITPYNLFNWTDGEVLRAITAGVDRKGKALFPLMAYHRFGNMDQEDIFSIIAYLRTLEPVKNDVPESEVDFPVNLLINTMPERAKYKPLPPEKDIVKYGAYLANATGCVDCHSRHDQGKVVPGTEYGGGMVFKQPGGVVRSSNITFDRETGIGNWTKESFVARFKLYADKNYKHPEIPAGELNTPMPWNMYAGMKTSDLEAIFAYLKTIKPMQHVVKRSE